VQVVLESHPPPVTAQGPLSERQLRDLAALNQVLLSGDGVLRVARVAGVGVGRALVFVRITELVEQTVVSEAALAASLRQERSALLTDLVVSGEHRRRGVGTLLVDDARRIARAAGLARLGLEVRADNAAACGLYERLGFTRIGDGEVVRYSIAL
jgi:[ribosomal protein S18]-alanine N-acetyltransferase